MRDHPVEHFLCAKDAGPWLLGFLAARGPHARAVVTIRLVTGVRVGDPLTAEFLCLVCGRGPALSVDSVESAEVA